MNKQRVILGEAFVAESYDAATGNLTITVIKPGFNKSKSRYYPAETLRRDHKVFEGAKMFADHQTEAEARSKPEGSVNNWVANVKKVWAEADGTVKANAVVIDPAFKAKMAELSKNNMLKEMGVSIRAIGVADRQKIEGHDTNYIESLVASRSVDFVTYAGAGGQVEAMESVSDGNDLDLMTEAQLRERRPDLVAIVESNAQKDRIMTIEQQLTEAQTALATEKARSATAVAAEKARADAAETKIKEADKKAAQAEIGKLISESKLPKPAQDKLVKQFAEADKVEGVKEAIQAEKDYIKSVLPAGAVSNMGETDETKGGETKVNLVESFKLLGLNDKEAAVAAKGR